MRKHSHPLKSGSDSPAKVGPSLTAGARTSLVPLGVLVLATVLPLYAETPIGISLYLTALIALHLAMQYQPRLRLGRIGLFVLTALGIGLIFGQFKTLFGYQAGIALFALMLGLKLLEIRRDRDFYITVILCLFFLVMLFLLDQSMYLAIYSLILVSGLFALLPRVNRAAPRRFSDDLKLAAITMAQAIPLVMIMFLLFPRLQAPLWELRIDSTAGLTGLSDSMEPGSISQLIRSDEPAFRAQFEGPPPRADQLYWRGPVMWSSNGQRWFGSGPRRKTRDAGDLRVFDEPLNYSVILEPHGKRWILALDLPVKAPSGSVLSADFQLKSRQPLTQKRHYRLTSHLRYHTGPLSPAERAAALQLPVSVGPRMSELVARWRGETSDQRQLANKALDYFNQEAFVYTLNPPLLGAGGMERFLFQTRAGFCEHYASAFTLLMRMAGIPSRVVTGYLGGEYNELGGYLMVRQSDAHAWSEIWLENAGWVRIDPTAAIAPERVQGQIQISDSPLGSPISFTAREQGLIGSMLRAARMSLDAVNTRWHSWVLGYDDTRRDTLLRTLGLEYLDHWGVAAVMVLAAIALMGVLALGLARARTPRLDPVSTAYRRFCRKLARVGLARAIHEGPADFARRASRARPDLAEQISAISSTYIKLKFSPRGIHADRQRLIRAVQRFHPARRR